VNHRLSNDLISRPRARAFAALCIAVIQTFIVLLAAPRLSAEADAGMPSASHPAQAQLRGLVVDSSGAAIPNAQIELAERGAIVATTESDAAGEFRVAVTAGRYSLHVERAGFRNVVQDVDLSDGRPASLTIALPVDGSTQSVQVDGESGFRATTASSASRIPLDLVDTPQSVDVLTSELLRTRAVESMKQAVEVVPAVGLQLGEGRRDNFFIRGFNAVGDMYIDGVRDDAQYYRDLSNTERIEVLEGPAAALYGRGSSGGLINRITKKPSMEGTLGEFSYTAGSYDEQRGQADLDMLIPHTNGQWGFRLTGAAEHEGSQRHQYWMDRYAFAPTLEWKPSEMTAATLNIERLRDDRLPDRGIPYLPATGRPADVPVGNFYGYVGPAAGSNFIHSSVTDGTFDFKHTFQSGWTVHEVARKAGYQINFINMYASAVTPLGNGDYSVARGEYNGTQPWDLEFNDLEAYRSGRLFGLGHTFLIGAEYGRETTDATQYNGPTNQTPVDLMHPGLVAPILSTTLSRNNRFFGQTLAVYAQDLVTITPRLQALIGVRYDNFKQALDLRPPTNTTPDLGRTDNSASPRVGLVYKTTSWSSLYGNYSRTFDPSGENLSLATNNAQLKPEVTQNYEAGWKFSSLHSRLLTTVSLYRLDRTNIKTTDPNDPTALLNLGEQRTNGAEVSFQGQLASHWMIYGGYAWLDGRIVSSNTTSNGINIQGKRPAMVPLHSGSLWSTYQFANGVGFGGGLVSRDDQFASTDNLAMLPSYTRVDAMFFYRRARYEVQGNLVNAGNLRYFDAAQSDYQIYPAAPINGSVTVRWRF
jgi:catecholate siderophore receptor